MWQVIMEVFCCLVLPHLHLAWYNLTLDWTIFPLELASIQVVLTTPKKTKCQLNVHVSRKESTVSIWSTTTPKLTTNKEQILQAYSDLFNGIECFPGPPYQVHVDPSITPKQTPCQQVAVHLKQPFKQEIDQMLQAGILKPVHQATPWINRFVLVEGKDKLGKLKLRICLDPTNLNKALVHKPYHFKTPEDFAHLLADACVLTASDCRKGFWHQQLDEASSFLTTFSTELGRFCYTVMPFGGTAAGDVFQHKLDECFGTIEQVIIIADDIMIVGYNPNHSDHDQAFTTLLQTARKCNVKLSYDKLQYKQNEVEFFGETYQQVDASQVKIKWKLLNLCLHWPVGGKYNLLLVWLII